MSEEFDLHANFQTSPYFSFDMEFYDSVRASRPDWREVARKRCMLNRGAYMRLDAGQIIRFFQPTGPMMIDVWWYSADAKDVGDERYDIVSTIGLDGLKSRVNSRVWTQEPWTRPIATYVDDNIDDGDLPSDDYWPVWPGGHCTPEVVEAVHGIKGHSACYSCGVEAFLDAGIEECAAFRMASASNMALLAPRAIGKMRIANGNMADTWLSTPSRLPAGTYIDYYVELDSLICVSNCPYGDGATGVEASIQHPIDLIALETGIKPLAHPRYHDWRSEFLELYRRRKAAGDTGAGAKNGSKVFIDDLREYREEASD